MSQPYPAWPSSIAAALFDFDGTLVDTMPLHFEAYRRVLAAEGIALSAEEFAASIGGNARETIPKLISGRSCRSTPQEIHTRKKAMLGELLTIEPLRVLETAKLISVLAGHMPLGLVSSGSREGIEVMLDRLGWRVTFRVVITGEDAANGKPAPDLFLLAARRLGVAPSACVVFEDTDAGLEAGRRAGMLSFDVRAAAAGDLRVAAP